MSDEPTFRDALNELNEALGIDPREAEIEELVAALDETQLQEVVALAAAGGFAGAVALKGLWALAKWWNKPKATERAEELDERAKNNLKTALKELMKDMQAGVEAIRRINPDGSIYQIKAQASQVVRALALAVNTVQSRVAQIEGMQMGGPVGGVRFEGNAAADPVERATSIYAPANVSAPPRIGPGRPAGRQTGVGLRSKYRDDPRFEQRRAEAARRERGA